MLALVEPFFHPDDLLKNYNVHFHLGEFLR